MEALMLFVGVQSIAVGGVLTWLVFAVRRARAMAEASMGLIVATSLYSATEQRRGDTELREALAKALRGSKPS